MGDKAKKPFKITIKLDLETMTQTTDAHGDVLYFVRGKRWPPEGRNRNMKPKPA